MDKALCSVFQAKRKKKEEAINAKTLEAEKRMKVTVIIVCSLCGVWVWLWWTQLVHACVASDIFLRYDKQTCSKWITAQTEALCVWVTPVFPLRYTWTHTHTQTHNLKLPHWAHWVNKPFQGLFLIYLNITKLFCLGFVFKPLAVCVCVCVVVTVFVQEKELRRQQAFILKQQVCSNGSFSLLFAIKGNLIKIIVLWLSFGYLPCFSAHSFNILVVFGVPPTLWTAHEGG